MWELNDRFPEVPAKWRAKSLWTVLKDGPWQRTPVQEEYVCCVWWTTWRYASQRILRIISGCTLAFGFSLSVRWVPSEYNSSDEPSRGGKNHVEHPHGTCATTRAPNQVQCSSRVNGLSAGTPSPPLSSPTISKRMNAEVFASHGQCGGSSTCRDENSGSSSNDGNQKHKEASTDFERSLREEKGSRFNGDAKP